MCAPFIASLAGVSPVTARRYLKQFGSAKKNNCTVQDIRAFIFHYRTKEIAEDIRKNGFGPIVDDLTELLQQRQLTKL